MPQNEKNAKPIGGPGGRGGHGPRPNVKNPGKLFMRLLSYIMKNYAVHCVIVVICIFITVLASVTSVSGMLRSNILIKTLTMEMMLFKNCGILWLIIWRRVSMSLV